MRKLLLALLCYVFVTSASLAIPCITVQCPSNIVVTTCSNCATVYFSATATNRCCSNNVAVQYSMASGSCFPLGTNTVVATAYDPNCTGTPLAQCSFTVTVLPNTNGLTLNCTNIVVTSCTNTQVFFAPTVIDPCCLNWTVTYSPTNGSYFALGTTNTVQCQVVDWCGLSNNCSFTVAVQPETNCPTNCITLICPSNIVATTCSNCATVYYSAFATNVCCSSNVALYYSTLSGSCFPLGTNTVTVTAYDPNCASTPPQTCNFTVTVTQDTGTNCCSNPFCCGPGIGAQTINWMQFPPTNAPALLPDPSGSNTTGTWFITNLPCYGNVLVTQTFPPAPNQLLWFSSTNYDNAPNANGSFRDMEGGYGPYSWGSYNSLLDFYNGNSSPISYKVNFYFLNGQPNPCTLFLAAVGLANTTTATVSQPMTFRGEYDLYANVPQGILHPSAYTSLNGVYPAAGVTGTTIGSAYSITTNYGDPYNTGWALLQPANALATTNLPPGSGAGWPGALTNVPYFTLSVNQLEGDGIGFTLGNVCCTNCFSNCLQIQCPPPKTAQCGTPWTFDSPSATSCCTNLFSTSTGSLTNIMITAIGAVTNGICPKVVTQTWLIADACGNTNTCSQTVTVVDTTPPFILNCPPPPIIVPLSLGCKFVIPPIQLLATDNCTPTSALTWSQTPPAGTIYPPSSVLVTVTVTDLCSNSSHCSVVVQSQAQTGPVISCPSNMTVTNCTVPLVPVTVSNNCCPSFPTITQSPPAGSTLCPGINSVTVTVTDCHANVVTKRVSLTVAGPESFLGNLTNTGASSPSSSLIPILLPDGVKDAPYSVPAMTTSGLCGAMPADYNVAKAPMVVSPACYGYSPCAYDNFGCYEYVVWSLASTASKWIAPNFTNNGCDPCGDFTYSLQFNLPVGINPATATISGRYAVDNAVASMELNSLPVAAAPGSFNYWTPFTIPAGTPFVSGLNTLTFVVDNYGSWTGLRVEFTNAYGNCCTCSPPISQPPVWETLPLGSTATFTVSPAGTPPFAYQWYKGGPLANGPHYSGVTTPSMRVHPIGFADAGVYYCVISNACGSATDYFQLRVTLPWPFTNALWNVAVLTNPLAATIGPDLIQGGSSDVSSNYSITSGTTDDLGLPEEGGQVVNVMHVIPNAMPLIEMPPVAAPGASSDNSYTLMMDLYEPDTSMGTPCTLFASVPCCVSNLSSGGQDGVALTLDASNNLHILGSSGGVPFDSGPAGMMAADVWNRVGFVVDDPQDGVAVNLGVYLNGLPIANLTVPTPVGLPINWSNSPPILLSVQTNAMGPNGDLYASSIQFYAAGLSPQAIASMGSPGTGPAPILNAPTGGTGTAVLSATLSKGQITVKWSGSPFVLQETTDLSSGSWMNSVVPFTETEVKGEIMTTAAINPSGEGPTKFYRLANDAGATTDGTAQGQ